MLKNLAGILEVRAYCEFITVHQTGVTIRKWQDTFQILFM